MSKGYYMMNREVLKFEHEKDIQKIIFNHYLMRKENLNAINGNLPKGQFHLTVRVVSKDLDISTGVAHRMIKEFEELKIIELIKCGKKSKSPSIYKYITIPTNNRTNYTEKNSKSDIQSQTIGTHFGTDFETSKIDNINTRDLNLWISEFGR